MCVFFPVQVVLPSASGFWNGVFMPLKVSDLYFSNQRRCELCNFFILGFFFFFFLNTRFSPSDGFDFWGGHFFGISLIVILCG